MKTRKTSVRKKKNTPLRRKIVPENNESKIEKIACQD